MTAKIKRRKYNPTNIFAFLLQEERRSSTLLVLMAAAAIVIANSASADSYFSFFRQTFTFGAVQLDLRHWINEGLMALFFFVVSLEVKRELIDGELRSWRKASFPLVAAIGGMLLPAVIFAFLNTFPPHSNGWGIAMATDIAIAVGVLALLGRRVPKSLRIFLLSIAIIDDIGSIIIISLFYQQPSNILALLIAVMLGLRLLVMRNRRFWPIAFLVGGLAIAYCLLAAGVSATMAGVAIAALMPLRRRGRRVVNLQSSEIVEDVLIPTTTFIIVPLFVFANAGLRFSNISLTADGGVSVFVGVAIGLLLGKPIGILCGSWIATILNLAHKPSNLKWSHITSVGFLAGIGFTVSLLIADLSYKHHQALQSAAVLGIFSASIAAGFLGLLFLHLSLAKRHI